MRLSQNDSATALSQHTPVRPTEGRSELKGPAMAIAEELGRINRQMAPPIPLTGRLLVAGERVVL